MATLLLRSILPVASKVKFGHSIPRNFEKYKCIYPEASMYIVWPMMLHAINVGKAVYHTVILSKITCSFLRSESELIGWLMLVISVSLRIK